MDFSDFFRPGDFAGFSAEVLLPRRPVDDTFHNPTCYLMGS